MSRNSVHGMIEDIRSGLCDASNSIDEREEDIESSRSLALLDEVQETIQVALRKLKALEESFEEDPREKGDDDGVEYGHPLDREYDR